MNSIKIKKLDNNVRAKILYTRITEAKNKELQDLADEYSLKKSTLVRTAINELLSKHS